MAGNMRKADDILRFITAGSATFTVKSVRTGKHFTYHIKADNKDKPTRWGVELLTGPDRYDYLGTAFASKPFLPASRFTGAPSVQGLLWLIEHLKSRGEDMIDARQVEFSHAGVCGRCRRELTEPLSLAIGLGPECRKRS